MKEIGESLYEIQVEVKKIQDFYFNKISQVLVSYYNKIKKIQPELFNNKNKKDITSSKEEEDEIENLWNETEQKINDLLLDMLEEIYELTSRYIRDIYGDDVVYPPSQIKFFDKDGKTISDRLNRWFNPYNKESQINKDFIKTTTAAVAKIDQISMTEALNQMELVKFDKLFGLCDRFTIENYDEEDDCGHIPSCDQYWTEIYRPNEDGTSPIPPPPYHPDCECYAVYYLDNNKLKAREEELNEEE